MSLFKKKPPDKVYEWHCPKHGRQAQVLNFEYHMKKYLCVACIGEKLLEAGVYELVKKETT